MSLLVGFNGQESDHLTNPPFRFEPTLAIGFMYLGYLLFVRFGICNTTFFLIGQISNRIWC